MATHHDRTLALGRKQPRRSIPVAVTNPQQVIGRLYGEHLLQQLAIGIDRPPAVAAIDTMLKQKRTRCLGLNAGVHQQIRSLGSLDHRIERQGSSPAHQLLVCFKLHVVKLLARRPTAVDIPGLGIERVLANDRVEHNLLVVALKHASVGQRPHQVDDTDRIGTAVDHVAQHI